ncbi:MAG: hypothetical protein WBB66_05390, partial [Candidatus Omnitrophota bacterium]
ITGVIAILILVVFFMGKDAFSKPGTEITTPTLMMTGTKLPPAEIKTATLMMTGTKLPPAEIKTATLMMTGTKLPPTEIKTAALMMTGTKLSVDKISLPTDPKSKPKKIIANPIEMTGVRGQIDIEKIKKLPGLEIEGEEEMRASEYDEFDDEMTEDRAWPAAGQRK